jgi:ribosomal protein S27AE
MGGKRDLPTEAFSRSAQTKDGLRGQCRECVSKRAKRVYQENRPAGEDLERRRARAREWREENMERHQANTMAYRQRNPDRKAAQNAVYYAVRGGELVRQPCEVCGDPHVHAHHDDYTKRLEVRWLCSKHHAEADVERRAATMSESDPAARPTGASADA